jgi:hypothetical protein
MTSRWQLYYFSVCLQSATTALLTKISTKLETLTKLSTQCSQKRYREASSSLSIYTWGRQPKDTNQTHTRSPNPSRKPSRTRNKLYKLQTYQIWTPSKFDSASHTHTISPSYAIWNLHQPRALNSSLSILQDIWPSRTSPYPQVDSRSITSNTLPRHQVTYTWIKQRNHIPRASYLQLDSLLANNNITYA